MPISLELQRIYASAPVNVTWYDALVLSHSTWDKTLAYITNTVEIKYFNLDGKVVEFQPATFTIQLPKRDDLGLVDLAITFPITSKIIEYIDLAQPTDEPIVSTVTTYIDGSNEPQMEPIRLFIDQVALSNDTGTARAQRIDLLNRTYPRNIVRPLFYPGLWR